MIPLVLSRSCQPSENALSLMFKPKRTAALGVDVDRPLKEPQKTETMDRLPPGRSVMAPKSSIRARGSLLDSLRALL